ncbi:MAG: NADPH-dependent FMN reductase [Candidatus Velthaea sp.]
MSIVILVGSATTPGRTHTIAAQVGNSLRARDATLQLDILDLAQVSYEPADGRALEAYDRTVRQAVAKIEAAAGVVIASPVYRATYTGILKNFLDILPVDALRDKPVGVAVVGASFHHYLGVDTGLRSVLAWFGALALPTSVYLTSSDFDDAKRPTPGARGQLDELADTLLRITREVSNGHFGPEPLAARANRG